MQKQDGYHALDFFDGYNDYKLALYPFGFPFCIFHFSIKKKFLK